MSNVGQRPLPETDFLRAVTLFRQLDAATLQRLAADLVERQFAAGEIIFRQGDDGQVFYLLHSGQVRIYVNGMAGNETSVILIGRPGQLFGELAVIDNLPRSATAVAMDQTRLYTLNREILYNHMRRSPQLSLNFLKELSLRLRYNTRQMDSLASLDVPRRLARKLVELAQQYGRPQPDGLIINLALTQTELATLIGATRESTNKALRDFRQRQWIQMAQGRITILNLPALHDQAGA